MSLHEDRIEKTLGSVTGDYDGQIPEPLSRIEVLIQKILENGGGSGGRGVPGIILNESQYDIHGVPIIDNPIEDVYYMVPNTDSEQGGYIIYMYVDEEWVNTGTTYEQDETVIERVDDLEDNIVELKTALLDIFQHVAFKDNQGDALYTALYNALNGDEPGPRQTTISYMKDGSGELTIVPGHVLYRGTSNKIEIRNSAWDQADRRALVMASGDNGTNYIWSEDNSQSQYYPIPIPEWATEIEMSIVPAERGLIWRVMSRVNDVWSDVTSQNAQVDSASQSLTAGTGKYLMLGSKWSATDAEYTENPDSVTVIFKEV